MVGPQGLLLFPGIASILDWSFTLTHGVRPNVASLTIAPQGTLPTLDGDMTIMYGGQVVATFVNCRIDSASIERNTQNMIVRLNIMDRRWKWATPVISGFWNQWKDNTDLGNAMGVNERAELVASSQATPVWLLSQCLLALGEELDAYDLSTVPNNSRPTTEWDYTPAIEALTQVADYVGCRVIMKADETNSISIEQEGVGADLPQGPDVQYFDPTVNPPEIPSGIAGVGARIRYNLDFELEAIGIDNDGTVKLLKDLSYAPTPGTDDGGWSRVDLATMNQISDLTVRARALSCVYRKYRIKGIKGFDTITEFPKEFNRLDYLPLEDTQIFSVTEDTEEGQITREKAAQVYGLFFVAATGKNIRHDNTAATLKPIAIEPGMVDPTDPYTVAVIYNNGFGLDARRGIVTFGEPVFMWAIDGDGTGQLKQPATMILRTSCWFRNPETRAHVRYRRSKALSYGDQSVQPVVLLHDELQLKRYPDYSGDDFTVEEMSDNRKELDPHFDYYISQKEQTYNIDYTLTVGYSTLRNVPLDGAIREISWKGGSQGATTRVSRNNETSPHLFSYNERRFLLNAKAAADELKKNRTERFRDLQNAVMNDALLGAVAVSDGTEEADSLPFIAPGDTIG